MTKEEFIQKAVDYIQQNYRDSNPVLRKDSGEDLGIDIKIGSEMHHVYLVNAYREASQNDFKNWEKIIDNLLSSQVTQELTWEEAKDRIFPQIKSEQFVISANSHIPIEDQRLAAVPLGEVQDIGICWVIDLPKQMIYVKKRDLQVWNKTTAELTDLSIANLAKAAKSSVTFVKDFGHGQPMLRWATNDGYDAARLLFLATPETYDDFARYLGENFVVGIPSRDLLVAVPYVAAPLIKIAIAEEFKATHHAVSPNLYIVTRKGPILWVERSG